MTTEQEQWDRVPGTAWRLATGVKTARWDSKVWLVRGTGDNKDGCKVAFDPKPTEARAALRIPETDSVLSREEVHAEIRAHGTVPECEAITSSCRCPGCGELGSDAKEYKNYHGRVWHTYCWSRVARPEEVCSRPAEPAWLAEVQSRLPPGWVVEDVANFCLCQITAPNGRVGNSGELVHSPGRTRSWLEIRSSEWFGIPDPYGEQEPKVSYCEGCNDPCNVGCTLCSDCCECTSNDPSPCPHCGGMDEDARGPVTHPGRTDVVGPTNGLGLPRMPEEVDRACQCGARSDFTEHHDDNGLPVCAACYESGAWPGLRTVGRTEQPFDEFLAQREAAAEQPGHARFEEGDRVVVLRGGDPASLRVETVMCAEVEEGNRFQTIRLSDGMVSTSLSVVPLDDALDVLREEVGHG